MTQQTILIIIMIVFLICLVLFTIKLNNMSSKIRRQRKRIDRLLRGRGEVSVEELLENYSDEFNELYDKIEKESEDRNNELTNFLNKNSKNIDKSIENNQKKIESTLNSYDSEIQKSKEDQNKKIDDLLSEVNSVRGRSVTSIQKVALRKYDAFSGLNNNLSFSLCMLDSLNNGVILTSIYGREGSYIYAKSVKNAKGLSELSDEEEAALKEALGYDVD